MKNEYTSTEVHELLGPPRARLKEWIALGHIVPSVQTAKGRGTRYIFSTDDLYVIELYRELLENGLRRQLAGEITRILRMAAPTFSDAISKRYNYAVITRVAPPGQKPMPLMCQVVWEIPRSLPFTFQYQWAFNLRNIKERVDALID